MVIVFDFSSLLFIAVNGPPLPDLMVRKFVVSWLRKGRQSALGKARHVTEQKTSIDHRCALFCKL